MQRLGLRVEVEHGNMGLFGLMTADRIEDALALLTRMEAKDGCVCMCVRVCVCVCVCVCLRV